MPEPQDWLKEDEELSGGRSRKAQAGLQIGAGLALLALLIPPLLLPELAIAVVTMVVVVVVAAAVVVMVRVVVVVEVVIQLHREQCTIIYLSI